MGTSLWMAILTVSSKKTVFRNTIPVVEDLQLLSIHQHHVLVNGKWQHVMLIRDAL